MTEKEENKNIFTESKCSRCGNEYPRFDVVENKKVKNQGYYPDCECVVELKLKKWQIPILLGAAGLGEVFEGICGRLAETSEHGIDRYEENIPVLDDSWIWRKNVGSIINQIKSQIGINLEYWESAFNDNIQSAINSFVDRAVKKRVSEFDETKVNRECIYRNYKEVHLP